MHSLTGRDVVVLAAVIGFFLFLSLIAVAQYAR